MLELEGQRTTFIHRYINESKLQFLFILSIPSYNKLFKASVSTYTVYTFYLYMYIRF